jgi:hypothetical protein
MFASRHVITLSSTAIAVVILATLPAARPASGQWGGGWGFNRGGYASTAQQAAAYGVSEMLRAQGVNNMENAEAAKGWEEAKTLNMQNKLRWTETYFEMRKVNREARAAEAGPPMTQEQAIRLARMGAPSRLDSTQLDPVTGHIHYPLLLMQDTYAQYRDTLDKIFSERASSASLRYEQFQTIQQTIADFIAKLTANIKEYPPADYGSARNFLESLAHEARMPAG